jgi:hypothetical protein
MSEEYYRKARECLFALAMVLFTILAQAAATHAQIATGRQAGDLPPLRFFEAPCEETNKPASTGPTLLALVDVAGGETAAAGGLWLSGDTARGLAHLRWIAGNQPAGLLKVGREGKVSFDLKILARAAGVTSENTAEQRERIALFVRSDEGLLLLAEVTSGAYRFLLHFGPTAPTLAGNLSFNSILNLDNQFDSRINPRRPNGLKMGNESPPEGFDSLIAINPDAAWFNSREKQLLPAPQVTFHELAEAWSRVALGLDYLPQPDKPGAHDVATARELRLKKERPDQNVVRPTKFYILLVTREDWIRVFGDLQEKREDKSFRIDE